MYKNSCMKSKHYIVILIIMIMIFLMSPSPFKTITAQEK